MVATNTLIAAGSALAANRIASRVTVHRNEAYDSGIKAIAGLGLILGSVPVKVEPVKAAMLGAGTGLILAAAEPYVEFLA